MKVNPNQTKYDYMLENSKNNMNGVALTFEDRKITYEEMFESIDKYAKLLYKKGIRKGDLIGICALNTPESVYLLYALNKIGAVVVGYSPFDNKERVKSDVELTKPKMVITTDLFYGNFKNLEKALDFSSVLYSPLESSKNWKLKIGYNLMQIKNGNFTLVKDKRLMHLLKTNYEGLVLPNTPYIDEELSDIMFTGGSTGVHKGVDLTDVGLNTVVAGMTELFPERPGFVHLGNIPFGHMAYGRSILHYALCNGMEFALTLKAMPSDFYDELVRTRSEGAVGGPPHWVSLIEQQGDQYVPSSKIKKGSLSQLRYATSGGEAKKEATVEAINNALKYGGSDAKLGDGLGATETWACMIINNARLSQRDTLGFPISDLDIRLIDPATGLEVADGEKGILYVSGPSVMKGYHSNLEETNKVLLYDENGKKWLNTGDFIQKTEKGDYIYVGRQKRNFVSGCDNIYPEELEDLLSNIPEIREAVVTPISDDMVQYIPRYHISLYAKDTDRVSLEEKIETLVLTKLNENWLPGSIAYYDEPLKRMTNSKIDISHYRELDKKAVENGEINHEKAKELRLKLI